MGLLVGWMLVKTGLDWMEGDEEKNGESLPYLV